MAAVRVRRAMGSPFETTDTYTQYELLAPGSSQFRVTYFVTERAAGARLHLNGTRPGSEETELSANDVATGAAIPAALVGGPALLKELDGSPGLGARPAAARARPRAACILPRWLAEPPTQTS
jgi:hypothetical protein